MAVPTNTLSLASNLLELCKALFAHKSDASGHNLATQSKAGFMSPLDKAKLDTLDTLDITVDSALSATSTNPVQNKVINSALALKADASALATVATSGSYNDLSNKPTIPSAVTVDTALSSTSTNPVQNKVINTALASKANTSALATVATSGSYTDLSNKPTIPTVPTKVSAFTNDAGYLTSIADASVTVAKLANTIDLGSI